MENVNIYLEENLELVDDYIDVIRSCKKSNITLDYYDNMDYDYME